MGLGGLARQFWAIRLPSSSISRIGAEALVHGCVPNTYHLDRYLFIKVICLGYFFKTDSTKLQNIPTLNKQRHGRDEA